MFPKIDTDSQKKFHVLCETRQEANKVHATVGLVTDLRIIQARPADLGRYIDMLEEVATWLESQQIKLWRPGMFRQCEDYFAGSITKGEAHLAFLGDELVGTLRLLREDPEVWPDLKEDDGIYVYNLAVRRGWAGMQLGRHLLEWAVREAKSLGRDYVRFDCVADNGFLRRYYFEAGFVDRGEVDATYPDPIGTLRLQRFEKPIAD